MNDTKNEGRKTESSSLNPSLSKNDTNTRVGFSNQASEYRKAFYHFQKIAQNYERAAQQFNAEFQKNLNIKTQDILDLKGMSDYFERQLFKMARNPKQVRKNWSEDETLLLLSLVAYYCAAHTENFMNMVSDFRSEVRLLGSNCIDRFCLAAAFDDVSWQE